MVLFRLILFCLVFPPCFFGADYPALAARRIAPLESYGEILGIDPPPKSGRLRRMRGGPRAPADLAGPKPPEASLSSARDRDGAPAGLAGFMGPLPVLDPAWWPLVDRLAADGFGRTKTEVLFADLGPGSYSPAYMAAKIAELYGVGGIGVSRAADAVPELPEDYEQPLSDVTIGSCLGLMQKHAATLAAIENRHGVPARVIVAILLVETGLGLDLGSDPALRVLGSMAVTATPSLLSQRGNRGQAGRVRPSALAATLRVKSEWAYNELKALIRYADRNGADAARIPGSIYGAIGICQFMPSNIEPYGEDGDQDGRVDVFSLADAMHSVGKYLEANGWRGARTFSQQFAVIRTYNQDNIYAARVLGTSNHLGRAIAGKVPAGRSALAGGPAPASALDPSLRRGRRYGSRISGLGSYAGLLD